MFLVEVLVCCWCAIQARYSLVIIRIYILYHSSFRVPVEYLIWLFSDGFYDNSPFVHAADRNRTWALQARGENTQENIRQLFFHHNCYMVSKTHR